MSRILQNYMKSTIITFPSDTLCQRNIKDAAIVSSYWHTFITQWVRHGGEARKTPFGVILGRTKYGSRVHNSDKEHQRYSD
jgi:hypothetical protein